MTNIEKVVNFIKTYPNIGDSSISVDYGIQQEDNFTFTPSGSQPYEEPTLDVYKSKITVKWQYTCVLLIKKQIEKGILGIDNQIFIEDLQDWVIRQNVGNQSTTPIFGDEPDIEVLVASNGALLQVDTKSQVGTYSITLNVKYIKYYE